MTARTHDLAAFATLVAAASIVQPSSLNFSTLILCVLANQIGGIVPDIDQPTAPLWRNLPIGHFFGKLVDFGLGGHRFITHSLLGAALFGVGARALLGWLTPLLHHANTGYIWWAFMLGLASHLVMDTLTKEGVPWLLPIPVKLGFPPLKRLRLTTGAWTEMLVVFPALVVIVGWLLNTNRHYFEAVLSHLR